MNCPGTGGYRRNESATSRDRNETCAAFQRDGTGGFGPRPGDDGARDKSRHPARDGRSWPEVCTGRVHLGEGGRPARRTLLIRSRELHSPGAAVPGMTRRGSWRRRFTVSSVLPQRDDSTRSAKSADEVSVAIEPDAAVRG